MRSAAGSLPPYNPLKRTLSPPKSTSAAVPAAPKAGDRSQMTPAQKKDADAKAMAAKAAAKAAAPAAAPAKKK